MPDRHDIEAPDPEANIDWHLLDLLIEHNNQRPWSIEEIIRAHGNELAVRDGLDRLHAYGLIHRTGDFFFATRAAMRYTELGG
jgi:hypothetical protein